MDDTYICVYRKLLYNGHFHLPHIAFKLFVYLLLKANRFPNEQMRLGVGECWVSYADIQADCSEGDGLNLSKATVSKMLTLLEVGGYIKRSVTQGIGMKIKIPHYRKYQERQGINSDTCSNNELASEQVSELASEHKQEGLKKVIDIRPKYSDEHLELARYFRNLITGRKPDYKFSGSLEKWAHTMRLIMEQDQRSREKIKTVLDWSQRNSFWQNNILSPDKLRKQFDRLELETEKTGIKPTDYSKVKL